MISSSLTHGNSSTPLSIKKHLNPLTPALARGTNSPWAAKNQFNGSGKEHIMQKKLGVYLVARNDTSPESNVHATLSPRSVYFDLEIFDGSRGRNSVQGHVNESGDSSRSSSLKRKELDSLV